MTESAQAVISADEAWDAFTYDRITPRLLSAGCQEQWLKPKSEYLQMGRDYRAIRDQPE